MPLPFTPVPLTLQNFGVLLVGLTLGSRRGFAALALYLVEGAGGCRFSIPQDQVASLKSWVLRADSCWRIPSSLAVAGLIMERGKASLARACAAGVLAELVLFAGGLSWLAVLTHSFAQALRFGLYWFVFAEIIKMMLAAAASTGWRYTRKEQA